jgi:UPF0716 family protein affecting phage T7 exclusion
VRLRTRLKHGSLAFLYYLAVYAAVHLEAKRTGMRGLPKPDLPQMTRERIMLLIAAGSLIKPGLYTDLLGLGLIGLTITSQILIPRPEAPEFKMPINESAPNESGAAPSGSASSAV